MCRANKEEIYIPYGVGICGHVAKTKETINLKDAYEVSTLIAINQSKTWHLETRPSQEIDTTAIQ